MQNEPNFLESQMNVSTVKTADYENKSNWTLGENEPNTNPIKANTKPIKANTMPKQTQYKVNQSQFQTGHLCYTLRSSNATKHELVNRAKTKLLNFHLRNSLTVWLNSVKYRFLCSERERFYEELYGKEKSGRA